ncbi:MAG: START domain-containing protein [Myxococcales bacterium]
MRSARIPLILSGVLATSSLVGSAAWAEDTGWQEIEKKSGISVSEKEEPGRAIPAYRGTGKVQGSVLQVLAVVLDDARSKEWAKDVAEAHVLRSIDDKTEIVYSRSDQTWPVRDRDLVMKRTVEVVKPGQEFRVRLVCLPGEKAEVPKVVRIKQCETVFSLRKMDDASTFVELLMRVDPGGNHPEWAVRNASQAVPYDTLVGLRKQVERTQGQYAKEVGKWD